MMERITREQYLIEAVKLASRRGTCLRAQVGCIIVREGRILVTGYNGSLPGEPHCLDAGCQMEDGHCVRTLHAESNAICFAAKHGIRLEGTTLYSYGWKDGICARCKKLCLAAGIKEMIEVPLPSVSVTIETEIWADLRIPVEEKIGGTWDELVLRKLALKACDEFDKQPNHGAPEAKKLMDALREAATAK